MEVNKCIFLLTDLIAPSPGVCKTGSGYDWCISRRIRTFEGRMGGGVEDILTEVWIQSRWTETVHVHVCAAHIRDLHSRRPDMDALLPSSACYHANVEILIGFSEERTRERALCHMCVHASAQ